MNPWNLTRREEDIMEAVCRVGAAKLVARELGISHRTVELHCSRIRDKMLASHMVLAALEWHKYVLARSAKHESSD